MRLAHGFSKRRHSQWRAVFLIAFAVIAIYIVFDVLDVDGSEMRWWKRDLALIGSAPAGPRVASVAATAAVQPLQPLALSSIRCTAAHSARTLGVAATTRIRARQPFARVSLSPTATQTGDARSTDPA